MGGCRCTFRSCTINTWKNPGMHFFHYPLKKKERLEKWIKYAQYTEFKSLTLSQAKNKVICALHFRDEHFMNYKKDRLVPHAMPTLERLKNGMVLDYSISDQPEPMFLPPTTEKHLIPPKGYRQLGLPDDFFIEESTLLEILDEEEILSEQPAKRLKPCESAQALNKKVSITPKQSKDTTDNKVKTSISFRVARYEVEQYGGKDEITIDALTTSATNDNTMLISLNDIESIPEDEVCNDVDNSIKKEVHEHALATLETLQAELAKLKQERDRQKSEANSKIARLELELANTKTRFIVECSTAETARAAAKKAQRKVEELEVANHKLAEALAAAKSSIPTMTGQPTKPQLFNGMKKYMTASMTSLVRMEVFGGPEREWKNDEKQVCVELLRLGENVYDYISEEWRFRLPPKKLVNEWMSEEADEDEYVL